jgi:DNA-3-methyladenine glycosylase
MFGDPGHLYVYFTYGMHVCANIVCSPPGESSAVLIRAGEVTSGLEIARERRTTSKIDDDLVRGPARLTVALGIALSDNGDDLENGRVRLELAGDIPPAFENGPRTGVSGAGGSDDYPVAVLAAGGAERVAVQEGRTEKTSSNSVTDLRAGIVLGDDALVPYPLLA